MSERFSDEVLQRALEAYGAAGGYREGIAAMRAVLEGHLAEMDRCLVCDALLTKCECEPVFASDGSVKKVPRGAR